jgi:hypothetical protein
MAFSRRTRSRSRSSRRDSGKPAIQRIRPRGGQICGKWRVACPHVVIFRTHDLKPTPPSHDIMVTIGTATRANCSSTFRPSERAATQRQPERLETSVRLGNKHEVRCRLRRRRIYSVSGRRMRRDHSPCAPSTSVMTITIAAGAPIFQRVVDAPSAFTECLRSI